MKKILYLSLIALSGSFLLSGCASKQSTNSIHNTDNQLSVDEPRRPDFGQPERRPDIRGLVKKIIGNEVTILKIDRPDITEGEDNSKEDKSGGDANQKNPTLGTGGVVPGMGPGMGMGRGTHSEEDVDQDAMIKRIEAMSSGEETIIVPVGIQMLMPDTDNPGGDPIEATLADIEKNKMIQIWLDDSAKDRQIASFVLITR